MDELFWGKGDYPMFACYEFLTFFSFTLGNQTSAPISLWRFLQDLAVLKDWTTDLNIQIGKAGFKVDQLFHLECNLLKIFC